MTVVRTSTTPRAVARPRPRSAPSLLSAAIALASVAWSAAVIDEKLAGATLPGPGSLAKTLPYAMPALLGGLLLIRRAPVGWLDELVWIWVSLVFVAVLLLPKVGTGSSTPLAIPAVAATALAARRWPAAALTGVVFISGAYGSLDAFWHAPTEKLIALLLASLWAVSLVGLLFRGSRPIRVSVALWLFGVYLLITAIMVPVAPDSTVARLAFKDGAWFMLIALLIPLAGFDRPVLDRIAKGVIAVAMLVGAYAIFRIIAGPARAEFAQFATTPFNFVNGKLKPGGSFPTAQDMGVWMAAVVPFCFAAMLARRGPWRLVAALACGLCGVAAVESQLRIGLVGIVFGMLLVIALYEASRAFPGLRLTVTVTATVLGVAIVIGGLALTGNHSSHSFSAVFDPTSDPSFILRKTKWTEALKDVQTHPFGFGLGTASNAEHNAKLFFSAGDTNIDNGFLKILIEQGLLITVLFVAALATMLAAFVRRGAGDLDQRGAGIMIGAAGSMISFLVVMMAVDATETARAIPTWLIAGLGLAIVTSLRNEDGREPASGKSSGSLTRRSD